MGILGSKGNTCSIISTIIDAVFLGVGEPPLCMSCSALFAVKRAIEEARKDMGSEDFFPLCKESVLNS